MAVNNGNLHKLPLKSTLNINRFENEINDWKQYVKLNSPVYGGVLSNFYEKDITLADGHKFITYDSKDRLWTKKYNTDTTNTDVYCDNNLIYSFSNETAEKENLQEDYNIIAGTRDYKVFSTEYNYAYISSHFIKKEFSFMTTDLMLVAYKELETDSTIKVDLYECEEGEKTKVKSYSFTLPNILADFFITGFVNTNGVLFFSILPYGEIDYDNLFSYQTTYAVSLLDNANKYELMNITYSYRMNTLYENNNFIFKPNSDNTYLSRYHFSQAAKGDSGDFRGQIWYGYNNHLYESNQGYMNETSYARAVQAKVEASLSCIPMGITLDKKNVFVNKDKIYAFPEGTEDNDYGIKYGKYEYYSELNKDTNNIVINGLNLTVEFDELRKLTKTVNYYVYNDNANIPQSMKDVAKPIIESLDAPQYTKFKTYNADNNELSIIKRLVIRDHYGLPGGDGDHDCYLATENVALGTLWQELKTPNFSFYLSPVEIRANINNKYKSIFHGIFIGYANNNYNHFDYAGWEEYPILIVGSDFNGKYAFITNHINSSAMVGHIYQYTQFNYDVDANNFTIESVKDNKVYYKISDNTESTNTLVKITDYSIKSNIINFDSNASETIYRRWYDEVLDRYNITAFTNNIYSLQCIGNLKNYKINLNKLGITYVLGEIFAITRGITNLVNNQIQKICSYENIDGEDIIYYLDEYNKYCSVKSLDKEDCINHQLIDDFIVFQTTDHSNNNFNTIDTEDITIFNIALDWNSRNSLFFSDDCGFVFDEGIICTAYNDFLTVRKRKESELVNAEETQAIMFVSAINAQFLSANNGIGENWCSSLTGVQFLKNIPNIFLETDLYNNNGYFGFDNENVYYLTNDKTDYAHFFIDNYMSDIKPNDTNESEVKAGACYYRFSMPSANPDLIDLVGQTSYPFESNVMLNPSIFDKFIASYYTAWFVKVNGKYYKLQQNGTTLEPVFAYEILTQGYFEGLFVINGSTYAYSDKYIMPITYNDGVINQGDPIVNIDKLQFIASTPYQAYFYSYQNRTIYSFTGDNTISKLFESNRITSIDTAYYNPATQDIWVSTNDGTLIINSDNTFIKIDLEFDYIGILKDVLYVAQEDNAKFISYNYKEDYDKLPIELETEFYGVDDFTTSINDCVYIRLVTDEEHNDFIGNVELSCETLTQISKKSETKLFHIEKSMWDKETNTILLRYQPKYQEGVGFRISLKSDFAISAIYINSTPVAITNSKNNI